jgi:hypothetical protein
LLRRHGGIDPALGGVVAREAVLRQHEEQFAGAHRLAFAHMLLDHRGRR